MFAKVVIASAICALTGLAQSNQVLPSQTATIAELSAVITPDTKNNLVTGVDRSTPAGRDLYRWSIAAAIGANIADVASSWHQTEANPVLGGKSSQFGVTSVAIKSGFVGTSLLIQHVALRHRPDLYKKMAWLNFATSGALGAVAAHNMSMQ